MAQHKPQSEEQEASKMRVPRRAEGEMFGIIVKLLGATHVQTLCEDKIERVCRIPGKMKKKVWMREGDLVIVKLWDFQPSKADVVWRYLGFQTERLKRMGLLTNMPY